MGELDPVRELPYRPAPPRRRITGRTDGSIRPTANAYLKSALALKGASTDGERTWTAVPKGDLKVASVASPPVSSLDPAMKTMFAILLLLFATALGLLELVAIIDPTGTKMADDGDPFGDPNTSWIMHTASVAAISASVVGAVFLLRRRRQV
jgi:hypothetical protein